MVTMVMVMVTMASPMMTWRPEVIIGVVGHPGSTGDAEEEGESDPDLFKIFQFQTIPAVSSSRIVKELHSKNKRITFAEFLVGVKDSLGMIMIKVAAIIIIFTWPGGCS